MTEEYKQWTQEKYKKYIESSEWQQKRAERLRIDNYTCQMCGSHGTMGNPIQVHHLDYHHIYNEDAQKDLVTLCRACHQGVHNMMNRVTNSATGQRGWKDSLSISMITYQQNMAKIMEQNRG